MRAICRNAIIDTAMQNLHPSPPGVEALKGANAIGKAYEMFQEGKIKTTVLCFLIF